ncbi:beta-L-arabinofuranosidase domain-containing protein [Luteolibacter sp. LG18]|uniref:beta-L-arabinofuranosidase domain-containing protein n=1 Tax=Luteolibacter sp. LG18 TaxID=2819286 RepID=UPI002B2BFCC9|nr:hypothetical protein llg_27920 [Luteolibacter sp. LG18]
MSLSSFSLDRVRLTGGPFHERQELHRGYLLGVEVDRLLAPFRLQAGLDPRASRYGGWESRDISGHSLGHYLSAISLMQAATGDAELLRRVHHTVAELALCQAANGDGYVLPVDKTAFEGVRTGRIEATPFSLNGVWVPFYTLHKLLAGLRDAHRLASSHDALVVAAKVADWLDGVLSPLTAEQIQEMLRTEHGGMNEVLADLSADTGNPRYLRMAEGFFHHQAVLAPLLRGEDRLDGLHGNTQIPKIVGLAREAELGGDPAYREAAEFFWDRVVNHRSYATGGHGESEHFFPLEQFPRRLTPNTCETCNTYNLLKLTGHLFRHRPDAARMDFVERAMINHLLVNLGRQPGEFGYFLGLGSVGVKVFSTPYDSWWCCVGTGLENPARYGEQIYARHADMLWVNLYLGSTLDWRERGVIVRQDTVFPEEDTVRFSFTCEEPVRFALKLRHPAWCAGPEIVLNGEKLEVESRRSSYFTLDREWRSGDTLVVRLPMALRVEFLPQVEEGSGAFLFGPTLLAAIVPDEEGVPNPSKRRFSEHLDARGKTDAFPPHIVAESWDAALQGMRPTGFASFRSEGVVKPADLVLVPFHRIYEEQYAVYFPRLTAAEWAERESGIRAERERQRAIEAGTLDSVTPGFQQPEVEHGLCGENSAIEDFSDRKCRLARDGGWFSYSLKCDPVEPLSLVITYWGGVWHKRIFEVRVDDELIATEELLANRPGEFFDHVHELPAHLTAGKSRVTVRFQSRPGDIAGGVFDLRLMRREVAPAAYRQEFVFKDH